MSGDNEVDYYEMSDEDFMNMPEPELTKSEEEERDLIESASSGDEDGFDIDDGSSGDSFTDDDDNEEESSELLGNDEEEEEEDSSTNSDNDEDNDDDSSEEDGDSQSDEGEEEEDSEKDQTNKDQEKSEAEQLLEEVFSPFKANGVEMQVSTPAEARRLMQQGANYNKKMEQLKPNLKILKKLGNNELLDESKLNYLIDLSKGDPNAVSKLLKEHNIDPLTVDMDKADGYKPNAYTVTDSDVALDETLSEIRGTSSYDTTLDVVNNKWDEASRAAIRHDPNNLRIINDHIEAGIYDVIYAEVQKQKALGNISGISDIDAYQRVGEQLKNEGALDKFFGKPTERQSQNRQQSRKEGAKSESKAAKKAAAAPANKSGSRKPASKSSNKKEVWEMTDEEFEKAMESGSLF